MEIDATEVLILFLTNQKLSISESANSICNSVSQNTKQVAKSFFLSVHIPSIKHLNLE